MNDSSPNQVKTLFSQAISAANSSRWDIAENACKEVLALQPDQLDATYLLGLVYQNTGHDKMAIPATNRSCHCQNATLKH